ncbi:GGDEF domain-containing protein [Halomonas pacifica]|uniref:GGDEF domain-containing protein n=1 Tax=Bisbaumannia pacifica TaxID=77098 RepID=UPI002359968D|nr:GGDEF domain-containing protein [Halomonas pacifica]MDC8804718.1 GGDEF domain-containing protein [Halomonas pacifica]
MPLPLTPWEASRLPRESDLEALTELAALAAELSDHPWVLMTRQAGDTAMPLARHGLSPERAAHIARALVQDGAAAIEGVASHVGVPLPRDSGQADTLWVLSPEPRRPDALTRQRLGGLARLAAGLLDTHQHLEESRRAATRQTQLLEAIKRASATGFCLLNANGEILDLNEEAARFLDLPQETLIGIDPVSLTLSSEAERIRRLLGACLEHGLRVRGHWPLLAGDGALRVAEVSVERLRLDDEAYLFCVIADKTLERLDETLRDAKAHTLREVTLENALPEILSSIGGAIGYHRPGAGVLITHVHDAALDIEFASAPALLGGGCPAPEANQRQPAFYDEATTPFSLASGCCAIQADYRAWWRYPLLSEDRRRVLGDLWVLVEESVRPAPAEDNFLTSLAQTAAFAMERQDQFEALRERAEVDPLTGLANRSQLAEALEVPRGTRPPALILIDLDDFKAVNDTHGHQAGDAVLVAVAERLRGSLRDGDTIARLGGDEFLVVIPGTSAENAQQIADKLLEALSPPVPWQGEALRVTPSLGVILAEAEEPPGRLLQRVDEAMYRAKRAGKGRVHAELL